MAEVQGNDLRILDLIAPLVIDTSHPAGLTQDILRRETVLLELLGELQIEHQVTTLNGIVDIPGTLLTDIVITGNPVGSSLCILQTVVKRIDLIKEVLQNAVGDLGTVVIVYLEEVGGIAPEGAKNTCILLRGDGLVLRHVLTEVVAYGSMDGPGGGRRKLAGDRTAVDTVVLRIVHTGEEEQTAANGLVAGVGLADTGDSDILMMVLPVLPGHPVATGIERLRQFFTAIGMPKNFAEIGAKEEDIPTLVQNLCYGDGRQGSIRGFVTLNEEVN